MRDATNHVGLALQRTLNPGAKCRPLPLSLGTVLGFAMGPTSRVQ